MQLRKLRQLCERLFKLPALPAVVSIESPEGSVVQCSYADGAMLADIDIIVRPPLHTYAIALITLAGSMSAAVCIMEGFRFAIISR